MSISQGISRNFILAWNGQKHYDTGFISKLKKKKTWLGIIVNARDHLQDDVLLISTVSR